MDLQSASFEESTSFEHNKPISLLQRLDCLRLLIFSKTKLEFRLIWNKIFQREEEEELGWLLSPYREDGSRAEATRMSRLGRNSNRSYQHGRHELGGCAPTGEEGQLVKRKLRRKEEPAGCKTMAEKALQVARYMGMGVYMTTTTLPSVYMAPSEPAYFDKAQWAQQGQVYGFSKLW